MKNAVIAFGFGIVIIMCVMVHSSLTTKDVAINEAEKALNNAVEQALTTMTIKPAYSIDEFSQLIGDLGSHIQEQLLSDSELEIRLNGPDWSSGKYELEFIQTIKLSNGNTYTASVSKDIHTEFYDSDEMKIND